MSGTGEAALNQRASEQEERGPRTGNGADDLRAKQRVLALAAGLVGASTILGLASRAVSGTAGPASAVVGGTLATACVLTLWLVRRQRLAVASWLFLGVAWSMVGAISVARGGLYSGTVGLYLLCTVLAGVLVSARAAVFVCGASIAGSVGLLVAEASELISRDVGMSLFQRALTAVLTLGVTTAVFLVALRQLQAALFETRAAREGLARANQELLASQSSLEETVRQRTQSLQEARDQALAAARSKMAFLANMSHELRTPMNAIIGVTELLKARDLDAESSEFVQLMADSADALVALLNDVLELSKIEAGRLTVEAAPWDVRATIAEVVALMGPKARTGQLELLTSVAGDVPERVVGDRSRTRQILLNLLDNALKFTAHGTVGVEVTRTADQHLRLAVTDSGPGVRPEDQGRLFTPFEQLDTSASRSHGGTGLGLAISKQLAGLMGGAIGMTSTPGHGSTFWFTVLAPDAPPAAGAREAQPELRGHTPLPARVLLVEDNLVNQRITVSLLAELGCSATVVDSGQGALEACDREAFEIVLMDIMMPGLDGRETTRRLRARPGHQPWIIAVTASAMPDDAKACYEAGVDDLLSKPVKLDALRRALARAVTEAPRRTGP